MESEWGKLGLEKKIYSYGLTTDKRGHLFVTDYNNECIQMFSASDGQYLVPLMKGVEIIGGIVSVHWSASFLVVSCYFQGKCYQCPNTNVYYFERTHTKLVVCYHVFT